MSQITMKELLEAGVHFGHQTKRWNPKMAKYIFGERNGIYIIDLQKTLKKFREAYLFARNLAADGRHRAVRRHQEAGPGHDRRGGDALRHVLRQPALAGRHAHQLHDDPQVDQPPQAPGRDARDGRARAAPEEGGARAGRASGPSWRRRWSASSRWTGCRRRSSSSTRGRSTSRSPRRRSSAIPIIAIVDTNCDPSRHRLSDSRQRRRDPRDPPDHLAGRRRA